MIMHHTQALRSDQQLRDTQQREELQSKDAEISGLKEQLRICQLQGAVKASVMVGCCFNALIIHRKEVGVLH